MKLYSPPSLSPFHASCGLSFMTSPKKLCHKKKTTLSRKRIPYCVSSLWYSSFNPLSRTYRSGLPSCTESGLRLTQPTLRLRSPSSSSSRFCAGKEILCYNVQLALPKPTLFPPITSGSSVVYTRVAIITVSYTSTLCETCALQKNKLFTNTSSTANTFSTNQHQKQGLESVTLAGASTWTFNWCRKYAALGVRVLSSRKIPQRGRRRGEGATHSSADHSKKDQASATHTYTYTYMSARSDQTCGAISSGDLINLVAGKITCINVSIPPTLRRRLSRSYSSFLQRKYGSAATCFVERSVNLLTPPETSSGRQKRLL